MPLLNTNMQGKVCLITRGGDDPGKYFVKFPGDRQRARMISRFSANYGRKVRSW